MSVLVDYDGVETRFHLSGSIAVSRFKLEANLVTVSRLTLAQYVLLTFDAVDSNEVIAGAVTHGSANTGFFICEDADAETAVPADAFSFASTKWFSTHDAV